MPIFKNMSKQSQDIETVRARYEAARDDLAKAQAKVDATALQIGLEGDNKLLDEAVETVRKAETKVAILEKSLQAAEQAERDRVARAQVDLQRAQVRAARQHISAIEKSARELTKHYSNVVAQWNQILDSAAAADRAMGNRAAEFSKFLNYATLRKFCEDELNRLGLVDANPHSPAAPGTKFSLMFGHPSTHEPLDRVLHKALVGSWRIYADGVFSREQQADPKSMKLPKSELE